MTVSNEQLRAKSKAKPDIAYPVQAEVEYRLKQGRRVVEVGRSHALSLSASELVLDSKRHLASGIEIELLLIWPAPLGTLGRLLLRIQGRTAASRGRRTTVEIARYSFETRAEPRAVGLPRKPDKAIGTPHLPQAAPFAS